jgi:hypothetical protein
MSPFIVHRSTSVRLLTRTVQTSVCRIQRNRERLAALGLPGLVQKFQKIVSQPKSQKKKRKRQDTERVSTVVKKEDGEELRRSSRLRNSVKEEEETAEARYQRQLGEFLVDGTCPKCGRVFQKGHRAHLRSCSGPRHPSVGRTGYSARDRELLAEIPEEDRADSKKRMIARMKALELSGLVDFVPADPSASFIVIGSKGDPYTVTLSDEKHRCTCLDHRFRRHNCKHICLVLSQLDTLDNPAGWFAALQGQMDKPTQRKEDQDQGLPPSSLPVDRAAQVAMKFV